jgi:hypothetical protein
MFGANSIFDRSSATGKEISGDWLWLRQSDTELGLSQLGDTVLALPAVTKEWQWHGHIPPLIEENIHGLLERGLQFISWVLDRIDRSLRLSHSVIVVGLLDAGYLPWRTRAEAAASSHSATLGYTRQNSPRVQLSPPSRRRQELRRNSADWLTRR